MLRHISRWSAAAGALLCAVVVSGGPAMASDRSLIAPVEDRVIHLSADLPIGPKRAFAYFSDSKLLRSWLAPDADVEAKVGGEEGRNRSLDRGERRAQVVGHRAQERRAQRVRFGKSNRGRRLGPQAGAGRLLFGIAL